MQIIWIIVGLIILAGIIYACALLEKCRQRIVGPRRTGRRLKTFKKLKER